MPKKDVLAIMLGGKPPGGKGKGPLPEDEPLAPNGAAPRLEEEPLESEYSEGFSESAEAAMESLQAGDVEGFVASLKDAIVTCVEEQNSGEY
jgi:hypothetical protein